MKKSLFLLLLLGFIGNPLIAQKYELRFNAGTNVTFVPNFANDIIIAGEMITPYIFDADNFNTVSIYQSESVTNTKPGFFAEIELYMNIGGNNKLSISGGINMLNFSYDTYVQEEGLTGFNLSKITNDYGNTKLLYINVRPINLSLGNILDKLSIQFGPSINFLIKKNTNNRVFVFQKDQFGNINESLANKGYFDMYDDAEINNLLFSAYLRLEYNLNKKLKFLFASQYFFDKSYGYNIITGSENTSVQLQAGLSYSLFKFKKLKKIINHE